MMIKQALRRAALAGMVVVAAGWLGLPAHARPAPEDEPPPPVLEERYINDLPLALRRLPDQQGGETAPSSAYPAALATLEPLAHSALIVFQGIRNNNWDLFLARGDGQQQTWMERSQWHEIQPKLNRGGNQIVYVSNEHGPFDIYLINTDGHNRRRVGSDPAGAQAPGWSPDSSRIVFQSQRDGQWEIYVMNADGSNVTRLTFDADYDGLPVWSPDGARIAFTSRRGGVYRIWVMNADGSGQTPLSLQPYASEPVWAPDSQKIAYAADGNGNGWLEVWRMDASGADQQHIYTPGTAQTDAWPASWTPDGQYIGITEVRWTFAQGAWYWTGASTGALGALGQGIIGLPTANTDWAPAWGSLDTHAPVVTLKPLPAVSPYSFQVAWTAADVGPAGILTVQVQMRAGQGGAWLPQAASSQSSSATTVTGQGGQTYYFRVQAIDRHLNTLHWPADFSIATTVEALPPVAFFTTPGNTLRNGSRLTWSGQDPGDSGISTYDIQFRQQPAGAWLNAFTQTNSTQGTFTGDIGQAYGFRIRAVDRASNQGVWSEQPSAVYTLYHRAITGHLFDTRGIALANASVGVQPAALNGVSTAIGGGYGAYLAANGAYSLTFAKAGYESPPHMRVSIADSDASRAASLLPLNNLVVNGGFEDDAALLSDAPPGWTSSGGVTVTTSAAQALTGHGGLLLQTGLPLEFSAAEVMTGTHWRPWISLVADAQGRAHWLYTQWLNDTTHLFHQARSPQGTWSAPVLISNNILHFSAAATPTGELHVIFTNGGPQMTHRIRSAGGAWGPLMPLATVADGETDAVEVGIAADRQGRIHMAYVLDHIHQPGLAIMYQVRNAAGTWQPAVSFFASETLYGSYLPQVLIRPDDSATVFVENIIYRTEFDPVNGPWDHTRNIDLPNTGGRMAYDAAGIRYAISSDNNDGRQVHFSMLGSAGQQLHKAAVNDSQGWADMVVAPAGQAYLVTTSSDVRVRFRPPGQGWTAPLVLGATQHADPPHAAYDATGRLHVMYPVAEGVSHYRHSLSNPSAAAAISQVVTLPANLHMPTLSLWYQAQGAMTPGAAALRVTISGPGGTSEVFSATTPTANWTQAWADLSAWAGQTVTLTIEARPPALHGDVSVRLDDISIGEWLTPVPTGAVPGQVRIGVSTPITISGQNFIKDGAVTPQVFFNGLPATGVQWINEHTLTAQTPALPMGGYDIRVANPGGQDYTLAAGLYSGHRAFLPVVRRAAVP